MRRFVYVKENSIPDKLNYLTFDKSTTHLDISLENNRTQFTTTISKNEYIEKGDIIAKSNSIYLHSPTNGVVTYIDKNEIQIKNDTSSKNEFKPIFNDLNNISLIEFTKKIGLCGMGGSIFPSSIKLSASKNIHTLVMNAVECEPFIKIDEALILQENEKIFKATQFLKEHLNLKKIVVAIKKQSLHYLKNSLNNCSYDILKMKNNYPAGAERLIISKLTKKSLSSKTLPFKLGYIVFNTASLWTIGNYLLSNSPSILRPLSIITHENKIKNIIVPIGTKFNDILSQLAIPFCEKSQFIIAGGLMMGKKANINSSVLKGTNAIIIRNIDKKLLQDEEPCILCSSCFDICPLNLHPISMLNRIKSTHYSNTLQTQLNECFLCGACSAVCPSNIPLVHYFKEGKKCLTIKK